MRISEAFQNRPLLIAYICAGDPTAEATVEIARRLEKAGADIIELGLPFSDPIADGPVIQAASQRALACGMNTDLYFETVGNLGVKVPKVFMGYYNMILRRGLDRFARDCSNSGISGLIVPDLPMEEAEPLRSSCLAEDVDLIYLIAPNTPKERISSIVERSSGFIYLVARSGVTGARSDLLDSTAELIGRVPASLPRAVGFGISTPEQAASVVRAGADAAIVGSACVDLVARGEYDRLEALIREMKDAVLKAK